MRKMQLVCLTYLIFTSLLLAYTHYTGYSGAPTSNGSCTRSCHIQDDFTSTCEVTGFPEVYTPGQQYTITVRKNSDQTINQFNCSIRVDSDSSIAGTISGGFNTEAYDTPNEANGIHWSSPSTDSGTFIWTAPEARTAHVTLYWSGLQGTRANGADTQIVLHASELGNIVDYIPEIPERFVLQQNYPNPFNNVTTICFLIVDYCEVVLEISNILGRKVYYLSIPDATPGQYTIEWDGRDNEGNSLPSGLYFYQLRTPEESLTRKMTILR